MISKLQLFALVVVTAAAIALGGCTSTPPQTLDTWTGEWVTPAPAPAPSPSPSPIAE